MSRMPRLIAPDAVWLGGLRACLRRISARRDTLLIAPGTAGADFVIRGAQRLGISTRICHDEPPPAGEVSDRLLIEQADEIFVLGLRKDGNIQQLLKARQRLRPVGVCLLELAGLQPDGVRQDLLAAGATQWTPGVVELRPLSMKAPVLDSKQARPRDDVRTTSKRRTDFEVVSLTSYLASETECFLTHTTRACPGPWPGQAAAEYLDSLLDSQTEADHSPLGTLRRILEQRRLIGSGRTIRGQFSAVSFTAVPLLKLPELRCFRPHRTHWDFEPYGLSIRRDTLERLGARPVIYGTDATWSGMAEAERPFFQWGGHESATEGAGSVDWSTEQEWRHLGDLDFSQFGPDELCVFVPTFEAAKLLQPICPWPITLWPGELGNRVVNSK